MTPNSKLLIIYATSCLIPEALAAGTANNPDNGFDVNSQILFALGCGYLLHSLGEIVSKMSNKMAGASNRWSKTIQIVKAFGSVILLSSGLALGLLYILESGQVINILSLQPATFEMRPYVLPQS